MEVTAREARVGYLGEAESQQCLTASAARFRRNSARFSKVLPS